MARCAHWAHLIYASPYNHHIVRFIPDFYASAWLGSWFSITHGATILKFTHFAGFTASSAGVFYSRIQIPWGSVMNQNSFRVYLSPGRVVGPYVPHSDSCSSMGPSDE
ncbi:hypothetical protein HGRIS_005502 [Hohenbuehelia grisea]|uniref:Uncharacterized protein n=1 Tax=Hohenbuehelia grisea TaxID=104357 RepID=A0ABR3JXX9_9AGAR